MFELDLTRVDYTWQPAGESQSNTFTAQNIFVSPTTTSAGAVFQANGTISAIPVSEANVAAMFQGTEAVQSYTMFSSSAQQMNVLFRRRQGTYASPTAVQSGNILGSIQWQGYGASTFGSVGAAEIRATTTQAFTESVRGTQLEFYTTANGSITQTLQLILGSTNTFTNDISCPFLLINRAAGVAKSVLWRSAGSTRWAASSTATAESGSNVGSDFSLDAYTDAGGYNFTALTISRSGGNAVFYNLLTAPQLRISLSNAPASATATGSAGTIRWDANYIYVCTATDTWKRVAIATWP
jgi:hypothetical protein